MKRVNELGRKVFHYRMAGDDIYDIAEKLGVTIPIAMLRNCSLLLIASLSSSYTANASRANKNNPLMPPSNFRSLVFTALSLASYAATRTGGVMVLAARPRRASKSGLELPVIGCGARDGLQGSVEPLRGPTC